MTTGVCNGQIRINQLMGNQSKGDPTMKVVRYLQIENKVRALVRYELAAAIPLVE